MRISKPFWISILISLAIRWYPKGISTPHVDIQSGYLPVFRYPWISRGVPEPFWLSRRISWPFICCYPWISRISYHYIYTLPRISVHLAAPGPAPCPASMRLLLSKRVFTRLRITFTRQRSPASLSAELPLRKRFEGARSFPITATPCTKTKRPCLVEVS